MNSEGSSAEGNMGGQRTVENLESRRRLASEPGLRHFCFLGFGREHVQSETWGRCLWCALWLSVKGILRVNILQLYITSCGILYKNHPHFCLFPLSVNH